MEEGYELDLTYITERIIAVSFPRACSEETYLRNLQDVTRMLQSKHGDSYLIINLSEKRHELSKMNPKTMDTGWLDLHAPPLDKMCTICKAMETWLNANPQHVVVIHCRGGKGRIGVVISSYVHFTNISASADQALDRFAMRRYYDDKVSHLMTPSQKRYVWILNSLLTGSMKMNTSLVFLHHVVLHGVPDFDIGGVCRPYLKVYQGMQAVYTSGIYHISPGYKGKICISLEPAQLLKGDIMIKCYHKSAHAPGREVVFRIQFHTGIIHGCRLTFDKEDLEHASKDPRFPDYGKIELFFSDSPEKMQGCERWQNGPEVVVDYNTADPTVRWDSYENMATDGEVHAQGPLDSSLYAKVRKKSTNRAPPGGPMTGSPEHSDHALSASSDSGLSSASARTGRGPSRHERAALQRLLSGFGLEPPAPPEDMVGQQGTGGLSTCATGGTRRIAAAQVHTNGERETDILDDEAPTHDLHSADSIGTLSSSDGPHSHPLARCTCHQNSQNSLLSDGLVSHVPVSTDLGFSSDDYERGFLPQGSIPGPRAFMVDGYSTQTWVRQQQMVAAQQYAYPITESDVRFPHDKPAPATPPKVPSVVGEGHDSAAGGLGDNNDPDSAPSGDDELASLTVDIDQSIDQLNQLIMDLDPTFVPIPTRSSSVRKDGKSHSNGSASLSANRGGHGPAEDQENVLPTTYAAAAGPACEVEVDQPLGLTQTGRDVVDREDFRSPGWGLSHRFQDPAFCTPDPQSPEQRAVLYMSDGVDYGRRCEQLVTRAETSGEMVPATPAFPVSPPTPYVKSLMDFSQMRTCGQPGGQYEVYRSPQSESRSYTEIMSHADRSPDNDPFRRDTSGATACQGTFGPARSVTSGSPLLSRTESPTSLIQQSSLSRFTAPYPGASEVLPPTLSCHSSPQGTLRGYGMGLDEADDADLPSLLGNGGLERSLLAAMEGLSHGGLGGMQPPLPEKRRVSEGEHSLGSGSPALSGFSSPHSGSTISIPFPSVLPDFSTRALATSSPIPDTPARQQVTVKFVQDTSKFWYKPEISRDQAIAILKDKDPGSFIVRDSHSFRGAYGLAMKVATPPPSVLQQSKKVGDLSNELVRHFLIECTQKGVRLKGCPNEPYFGSLTALVCQHSITPLALPCRLIIPDRDPLEDIGEPSAQTAANSAAELLKQGAACNVWFLGSVEMESLTGYQAVQKATSMILSMEPPPISTVVHFKVSAQGITLTDNQRKLFFRRHYAVNTVIFCALDPQNRKWTRDGVTSAKIFGFVARKTGSSTENVCHVFAEHDPEQPASAIVNFVSKVMIGSQKNK